MTPSHLLVNRTQKPVFLLTIDTEEEWDWFGKLPTPPFSTRNIEQIPEFQNQCREWGVRPSYFLTHSVIDNTANQEIFHNHLAAGECDLGAHLHPWCTPPLKEVLNEYNSHAINLSDDLFEKKIRNLTEQFTSVFGMHPYSFRAGRWGMNGTQLQHLATMGYRVDSSVRPFFVEQYFSYADARTHPYWPSFTNLLDNDYAQRAIIEVPASSGYNRENFEFMNKAHTFLSSSWLQRFRPIGILWQLGLLRKIVITPEGQGSSDICRCIDNSIRRGDRVINMFFHSSNLLPGSTPYVRTAADKIRFLDCVRTVIEYVRKTHDADFSTMREIRQTLTGTA